MKIQLPNRVKIELDENISLEEKMIKVEILAEEWRYEIDNNWESQVVRFFLDGLSNYIVWHKEKSDVEQEKLHKAKNKQDKDVLSIWKTEQMSNKRKANSIPFSCLSKSNKELLGIDVNNVSDNYDN